MPVLVHATSVVLGEACAPFGRAVDGAVLLLGGSGSGKSDVALRLIAMGAKLLADDQTLLSAKEGRLFAEAPPSLYGRMEIRGIGIITMEARRSAAVVLAVMLAGGVPRLPDPRRYELPASLAGVEPPPIFHLDGFEASTPAKIAAAAAAAWR
jgi:HPr kinase/phosphorylase